MVEADFQKQNDDNPCEDLMIKSVTIQGHVLGTNITRLSFGLDPYPTIRGKGDTFERGNTFPNPIHNHSYMELRVTQLRSSGVSNELKFTDYNTTEDLKKKYIVRDFEQYTWMASFCTVQLPTGFIRKPTAHSNKFRTPLRIITCKPNYGQHEIKIVYNSVWRGLNSTGGAIYQNDLSLYITNVGTEPAGIMGLDDVTEEIAAVPNCKKAQPVDGPFQYVVERGVKRQPKWKHHRHHR